MYEDAAFGVYLWSWGGPGWWVHAEQLWVGAAKLDGLFTCLELNRILPQVRNRTDPVD